MRSSGFYSALLCISLAFGLPRSASGQNCACGFIDSQQHVWRESIVSTFTQNAGALAAVNADWNIASDDGIQKPTGFKMQYVTSNVFQFNDALGMQTSAYDGSGTIKTAEIDSKRGDILYGTFRMRAQVPSVSGVVFGFFTYKGDPQEQDIEFVSSDSDFTHTVHYTNQPGMINDDEDPDAAKTVVTVGDLTTFGDHRIDWLPGQTLYYYNNVQKSTIKKNVPTTPSNILLNVWSNGDPKFSKGPPTKNAIATIQNLKLYFNSTALAEGAFNTACANAGHPARHGWDGEKGYPAVNGIV